MRLCLGRWESLLRAKAVGEGRLSRKVIVACAPRGQSAAFQGECRPLALRPQDSHRSCRTWLTVPGRDAQDKDESVQSCPYLTVGMW